jgi:hypothetical protein
VRDVLNRTIHAIGYAALTGAALWVIIAYAP